MSNWNKKFIEIADVLSGWSKDKNTGVGAVIADDQHRVISVGYNGFPRGTNDDVPERHERPAKYLWTEHAERNAIYSAASHGSRTSGCTIYLRWYPCCDCARAIIQSGIKKVVCDMPDFHDERWGEKFKVSDQLFKECGVEVEYLPQETYNPIIYNIHDKVSHETSVGPSIVIGLMENKILIEGSFSDAHLIGRTKWVSYDEVKKYTK